MTPERNRQRKRKWFAADPNNRRKHCDWVARWQAEHPEKVQLYNQRRAYVRKLVSVGFKKDEAKALARKVFQ